MNTTNAPVPPVTADKPPQPATALSPNPATTPETPNTTALSPKTEELMRAEAEWVTRELEEQIKLTQQYRNLYVTAVIVAVGWVLGQAVSTTPAAEGQLMLQAFRSRPDVAAVLCVIPFMNVLFGLLLLEITAQIRTLARYRFLLGFELGGSMPAWRWECWKSSRYGSTRVWTNPLNILFAVSTVGLTATVIWFSHPATYRSGALRLLWWSGLLINVVAAIIVGILAVKFRRKNFVAAEPPVRWTGLWPVP